MYSSSEFVSQGHPDRMCDSIASYILDEYLMHDPKTRFALEVQMKDHICNLAGEVTSKWKPLSIANLVREAIAKVGYTSEYASKWPDGATLNADKVVVNNFIGQQSPDIAQGVDREGWGDQGCFMGMATNENKFGYMPRDKYFANAIGTRLYKAALSGEANIGLDIKVLVSIKDEHTIEQVVVAAPMTGANEGVAREFIERIVKFTLSSHDYKCNEIIINGTGAYVVHSTIGDAGVVGRKLAVDFYGLNCPIGGGTTWGKDGTKADVTLNLAARYNAMLQMLQHSERPATFCKVSCCIGKPECLVSFFEKNKDEPYHESKVTLFPSELKQKFGLDGSVPNMFWSLCENGLFHFVDSVVLTK